MKTVGLAWLFFLLMGLLVSLVVPLGEGFDEPWHLGYVQYVATTGRLPPGASLHLSVELEDFLKQHPIGWRLHEIYPGLQSQEEYWSTAEAERSRSDAYLRELRFSSGYQEGHSEFSAQYESHQAPLYYVLSAPVFWASASLFSLADTFLLVRLWSVLVASTVVPLSYLLAKRVASPGAALAVTLLVAMFPGLYPDLVRVSNDALVVPLAAAVFLALALYLDSRSPKHGIILGLLLLAGLLTKAFFIPVLAAVLVALVWMKEGRTAATVAVVTAAGWFWYARNIWVTGSVTGLPETVTAKTTLASSVSSIGLINWFDVLHLAAVSHIWIGNWSLLQYRSWIYETVMLFFAVGLVGFLGYLRKSSSRPVQVLLLIYVVFAASLAYYATQVFQQAGVSVVQGWYLSPLTPIEALAFVLGVQFLFSRRVMAGTVAFVALCFLAMMVYGTLFIAAPYYTGITDHAPSGHLRAYHPQWADAAVISGRLTRFHPWMPNTLPAVASAGVITLGFFLICSYVKDRTI